MFVSITLPLKYSGNRSRKNANGFPSDFEIQQFFESYGYGIRRRTLANNKVQEKHVMRNIFPGTEVDCKTTLHYRDTAFGSIKTTNCAPAIERETEKYNIFYGSLPRFRSLIFVNRVTSGTITIYVSAQELLTATNSFTSLLKKVESSRLIDNKRSSGAEVKVYSRSKSDIVGTGLYAGKGKRRNLDGLVVDAVLVGIVFLLLTGFLASKNFAYFQTITFLTKHGDAIFQSLFASFVVLVVSLVAQYFRQKPYLIQWDNMS